MAICNSCPEESPFRPAEHPSHRLGALTQRRGGHTHRHFHWSPQSRACDENRGQSGRCDKAAGKEVNSSCRCLLCVPSFSLSSSASSVPVPASSSPSIRYILLLLLRSAENRVKTNEGGSQSGETMMNEAGEQRAGQSGLTTWWGLGAGQWGRIAN